MRLLLVEDSARLRELLSESLRAADYPLDVVGTARDFRAAIASAEYDLLIIDLGLPDGDGLALIRELREGGNTTPVLVITARAAVDDRVAGLDSGADDYLVKPFNHTELLARVRALLRRPRTLREPIVQVGNVTCNEKTGEIHADGKLLDLRPSERRLLALLMRKPGRAVPKSEIEESLSGASASRDMSPNAVETVISRLRKAMEDGHADIVIETVRGIGYMLSAPQ